MSHVCMQEAPGELTRGCVAFDDIKQLASAELGDLSQMDLRIRAGRRFYVDLGRLTVARLRLEFTAAEAGCLHLYPLSLAGEEAAIEFSSTHYGQPEYPLAWGTIISPPLQAPFTAGVSEYRPAQSCALRYLCLVATADIRLRRITATSRDFAAPVEARFQCDDPQVQAAWWAGVRSVQLCVQPAADSQRPVAGPLGEYVIWDGIRRDREVWTGDLRPEALLLYETMNADDAIKNSLAILAARQFDSGLLPASASSCQTFYEYALWWIIAVWECYEFTADEDFLRSLYSAFDRQMKWLLTHVGADALIEVGNTWAYTLPRRGKLASSNLVFVQALRCGARWYEHLGEASEAQVCRRWAAAIQQRLNCDYYDPQRCLYRDLPTDEVLRTWEDSNSQAILLDVAPEANWPGILANLRSTLWQKRGAVVCSPSYPRETLNNEAWWAHNEKIWPFANAYQVGAWLKAGRVAEGLDLLKRYTGACLETGSETIWEMIPPDGSLPSCPDQRYLLSLCHGWGGTASHYLNRYILGLTPTDIGWKQVSLKPNLGPLNWVSAQIRTPRGPIEIELEKQQDVTRVVRLKAPADIIISQ